MFPWLQFDSFKCFKSPSKCVERPTKASKCLERTTKCFKMLGKDYKMLQNAWNGLFEGLRFFPFFLVPNYRTLTIFFILPTSVLKYFFGINGFNIFRLWIMRVERFPTQSARKPGVSMCVCVCDKLITEENKVVPLASPPMTSRPAPPANRTPPPRWRHTGCRPSHWPAGAACRDFPRRRK